MSLRAMLWVLYDADVADPLDKVILWVLADNADDEGRGAWPGQRTIAETVPCDRATVQRHMKALEAQGLIVRGDQKVVEHFRADRRPIVWDLPLRGRTLRPRTPLRGRTDPLHGAADGAAPVRPNPVTPNITPSRVQHRDDGAPLGCASHGARRPSCPACQRVKPVTPETVRPTSPTTIAEARRRALGQDREASA